MVVVDSSLMIAGDEAAGRRGRSGGGCCGGRDESFLSFCERGGEEGDGE